MSEKGKHALREKFRGLRKRTKVGIVGLLVLPLVGAGSVAANAVTQAEKEYGESGHTVAAKWFDVCAKKDGTDPKFITENQNCGSTRIHYRWAGSKHPKIQQGGPQGEQGEPGEQGPKGDQGDPGQDGVAALETDGFYETIPATAEGEYEVVTAECAEGKYAIGGGFSPEDGFPFEDVTVIASRPSTQDGQYEVIEGDEEGSIRSTAWELWIQNETGEERNVRPWVTCAAITG